MQLRIFQFYVKARLSAFKNLDKKSLFLARFFFSKRAFYSVDEYTGLFISPSGTSELDCATTKKDTAERSISIGKESLKVFFLY